MKQPEPLCDDLVSPFLRELLTLRAACGGDLEMNIILLAIAERTIAHPGFRELSTAERMKQTEPFPTRGLNIRSIADSTGIPRETARRKVAALERQGWVVRTTTSLHMTAVAYRALTPAREGLEELAFKFHDLVAQRAAAGRG